MVANASFPGANAAIIGARREVRTCDLQYYNEITAITAPRVLFHQETLASTDTEAFAMSPLPSAGGTGLTLAQTSADTMVATQTGFVATAHFKWIPPEIGHKIGNTPVWAADVMPIGLAGIPPDSAMIFPSMTMIKPMPSGMGNNPDITEANASLPTYSGNSTGNNYSYAPEANASLPTYSGNSTGNNYSYAPEANASLPTYSGNSMRNSPGYFIDATASLPLYPGNIMLPKTVTDDQGRNTTVLEPLPHDEWTPFTSDQEIAKKTIIERMWANSHIDFYLDRAYVGETCFPTLIYPVNGGDLTSVIPMIPDSDALSMAMNFTRPGTYLRRAFWPVA